MTQNTNERECNLTKSSLTKLAKESQVRGYQNQKGIYIAVDKGFDTLLSNSSSENSQESLETYIQTCEKGLKSIVGTIQLKGILLKLVELGTVLGTEWDARLQVSKDFIAGPFETERLAMKVAPYVLQQRYGWNPEKMERINFYTL
jgi:hypothetical protein